MKKITSIIALLVLAGSLCFTACAGSKAGVQTISGEKAERFAARPSVVVLDVRTPAEYAAGHLPNAVNIDFLARGFEAQVSQLDKNKSYLVYCKSGNRSTKAVAVMEANGFKKLFNLAGGITGWQGAVTNH